MPEPLDLDSEIDSQELDEHVSNRSKTELGKTSLIAKVRSMRWWKKTLLYASLFLTALYLISLILINCAWFKSKIALKLEQKSGLKWQIGSVYWVPFGDIYINSTSSRTEPVTESDSGGISIETISVSPSWGDIFSGDLVWNEILLDGVVIDVEKQWLENQTKKSQGGTIPELKQEPKARLPRNLASKATPTKKKPITLVKPAKPSRPPQVEEKQPEIVVEPERRFRLKNCQIRVRNKDKVYLDIKDITMDVPFSGEAQTGELSILKAHGEKIQIPIEWDKKQIKLASRALEWQGVKLKVSLLARPAVGSVPFRFELGIDEQPIQHRINEPNLNVDINASSLTGKFILKGNLLSLQTWNGIGGVSMKQLSVAETKKTNKSLQFDRVYAKARMLHGNLLVEDAQAQSEEISFMANGAVSKNNYAFGVLRCVVNEEYCRKLDAIYLGSKAIRVTHKPYSIFQNLDTPDRKYFDLRFDGRLLDLSLKHNRSDQWQSFKGALQRLKSFKNNELKEDGLFLPEGQ